VLPSCGNPPRPDCRVASWLHRNRSGIHPEGASLRTRSSASAATGGGAQFIAPPGCIGVRPVWPNVRCSFPTYAKLETMWSSAGGAISTPSGAHGHEFSRVRDAATELTVLASVHHWRKGWSGTARIPKPSSSERRDNPTRQRGRRPQSAIARCVRMIPSSVDTPTKNTLFQAAPCPAKLQGRQRC
jgi:hypothetical protein